MLLPECRGSILRLWSKKRIFRKISRQWESGWWQPDNQLDAYLNVHEIQINKNSVQQPEEQERYTGTVTYDGISVRSGTEANYFDGSDSTEVQLAKGPYEAPNREIIAAGSTLTVTFDEPKTVGSFRLIQGVSAAADVFANADVEYQVDGSDEWVKAGTLTNASDQTVDFGSVADVTAQYGF